MYVCMRIPKRDREVYSQHAVSLARLRLNPRHGLGTCEAWALGTMLSAWTGVDDAIEVLKPRRSMPVQNIFRPFVNLQGTLNGLL